MNRWIFLPALLLCVLAVGCNSDFGDRVDANKPSSDQPSISPPVGRAASIGGAASVAEVATESSFDRDKELDAADRLMRGGQLSAAAATLQRVLLVDPGDAEGLFRLANVQAAMGDLASAVTLLDSIPADHPEAGMPALGQSADWCMQLQRFDEAERRYKDVLERVPEAAVAHRQLAYLYNRQGRRHEAAEHIQRLCELGDVRQDELHALMVVSHAVFNDPNVAPPPDVGRMYYPIGPAAIARKLYTESRFSEAAEVLHESITAGDPRPATMALYGRVVAEAQDDDRFLWWLAHTDDSVQKFSEYWAALGTYLLTKRRYQESVRALAEAIDRDPTDPSSVRRMNQALLALGENEQADQWQDRYVAMSKTTRASNRIGESKTPDLDSFATVIAGLRELDRPLEAVMWELLEAFYRKSPQETLEQINRRRESLLKSGIAFPDRDERLCGLDTNNYPLPEIELPKVTSLAAASKPRLLETAIERPRFENVAAKTGLQHTFQIAKEEQLFAFAIYQSLGGGVAVLDYDLDGRCDLYFAQGGCDPPQLIGDASNQLYRHRDRKLIDVTEHSGTAEYRYSLGVTSGDWNQDGFADLVIANIGNKVLMINNGDGTFDRRPFDVDEDRKTLPSSLALADVTGDALPDIVAIHDVEDKRMLTRPEINANGEIETVSPLSFEPSVDHIGINDGRGGLTVQQISQSERSASTGLGVVVADFDGKPGNEIFVGNDVRPNHLWVRSEQANAEQAVEWVDVAALRGCAHGNGGLATASMGIAASDFDGSGTLDLHVTNFIQEPASLFINHGGTFEDRCIQYQLYRDSASVLGFGSQAIDYNNDGRPDLAVTNGNIEKAPGEPLQQPPQLFANLGREFRLAQVDDPSDYWMGLYLGRGMARLDFDRDGKSDLVITHIGSPSALLLNQTETKNHWLSLQLVGIDSERDAIGARVQVRAGDRIWTNWAIAGDGYLSRNQATIPFGLGDASAVDEITVTWPGGRQQTFDQVDVDQHLLLVENEAEPFTLSDVSSL